MLSKRITKKTHDSIQFALAMVGICSTFMSILGMSLRDWTGSLWKSIVIVIVSLIIVFIMIYVFIGKRYEREVDLTIQKTSVSIMQGDIFEISGRKVIGCDSHYDLRIDDVVISKKSLHGQLVLNHAKEEELKAVISSEADRK